MAEHHGSKPIPEDARKASDENFERHVAAVTTQKGLLERLHDENPELKYQEFEAIAGDDLGLLAMRLTSKGGVVIIDFAKPVVWMAIGKENARVFAELILKHVDSGK